jgi:predicted nucleotidyltransferase component of viral defense system
LGTAFAQKIEALTGRSETQARDVFDLAHLSDRGAKGSRVKKDKKLLRAAADNVLSVPFDQFKSQVVAYLPAEYRDYYSAAKTWEALQEKVFSALESL